MAAELLRVHEYLDPVDKGLSAKAKILGEQISAGIHKHATFEHSVFGRVFAYEVDGYGSRTFMDDASPPSLLSLPYLGFIEQDDMLYQNTRRMVLSRQGNPYFLEGKQLKGQGSPHIDLKTMWPIGTIAQIITTNDDEEIKELLAILKRSTAGLGLIHEGVDVNDTTKFLRTWYAWGNSAFAEMIIDLAERKPHLLFV
ncbi:hypothetical protein M8818_006315 [Zalaria obscura]|uniref:Uncharacterized protein n=1 Tax=Zalaria obscura TaxID=2024903 RepID=A0ACC3S8I1_9PEZI